MTMRWLLTAVMLGFTVGTSAPAFELGQIEQHLKSKYAGRVLTLRNFYVSNWLRYTADGTVIGPEQTGTWTLYSAVEIKRMKLYPDKLRVEGMRRALLYVAKKRNFEEARTDLPLAVEIELPSAPVDEKTVDALLTKVFVASRQQLQDTVPPVWSVFLEKLRVARNENSEVQCDEPPGTSHSKEPGVTAARILSKVDPDYTKVARVGKVQGKVILCMVVQRDGTVGNMEIKQPVGLGLDESAIDAVKQWRFQPATRDGNPIDLRATVEVSFRLLR